MSCTLQNSTCNFVEGSNNLVTGVVEHSAYNYLLNQPACVAFVVVFGISAVMHLGEAIWSKQNWLIWTLTAGAVGECIGWSGRLWSSASEHWDPSIGGFWNLDVGGNSYLMQISTLIISPAFMAAGNYILLGRIIPILGSKYSFIHPLSYTIIFITGDVISLVVQAFGGGLASASNTPEGVDQGAKIMVGGVMCQVVVMIAYTVVLALFVFRYKTDRPLRSRQLQLFSWWPTALRTRRFRKSSPPGTMSLNDESQKGLNPYSTISEDERGVEMHVRQTGRLGTASVGGTRTGGFGNNGESIVYTPRELRGAEILLWACAASTLLIFIRSVYRSIELLNGWEGPIMKQQTLFNLLDGMLMALAVWIFNLVHPGFFLPGRNRDPSIHA